MQNEGKNRRAGDAAVREATRLVNDRLAHTGIARDLVLSDGFYQIGIEHEAPGPFESRSFGEAARPSMSRHGSRWRAA